MLFADLDLIDPLLAALKATGYEQPTPIQEAAIPPALAGRDVLGCAQTGTGKTAAFVLPILQRIDAMAGQEPCLRALILTPTRELAAQIGESLATYGKELDLYHTVLFGGVSERAQIKELRQGVDVLVATPGRLLDLMGRGFINLKDLNVFVLDEADRMLDMGFLPDIKKVIAKLPTKRQTLFFSATMPPEIGRLADTLLVNPAKIEVTPAATTVETIAQSLCFVDKANKPKLLTHFLDQAAFGRTIVFSRTKHGANRVVAHLDKHGVASAAIHGNKSQGARTRALEGFRAGDLSVLVATDIAARGIDVDGITHVVNFDLPEEPETYVHRIGRTARAGASGTAIAFVDINERGLLRDIERLIGLKIDVRDDHPFPAQNMVATPEPRRGGGGGGGRGRPGGGRGGGGGGGGGGRHPAAGGGGRPSGGGARPGGARRPQRGGGGGGRGASA